MKVIQRKHIGDKVAVGFYTDENVQFLQVGGEYLHFGVWLIAIH